MTADGLRSPMWLYAYEAITRGFIPGAHDGFIVQDSYFGPLRAKRVQFLDLTRGYTSISTTLRALRNENVRLRLMFEAIQDTEFDELDDFDEDEDDGDVFDTEDIY